MVTQSDQSVVVTIVADAAVGILLFLVFCVLRPLLPRIYAARSLNGLWAPQFGRGWFSWIVPTLRTREKELLARGIGLESVMFLRWLWTLGLLCVFFLISAFAIIVPLNATGANQYLNGTNGSTEAGYWVNGLLIISMSNRATLPGHHASAVLWVHFIMVWVFAIVVLALLTRDWQHYMRYRAQQRADPSLPSNYAVLVRDLPDRINGQPFDDVALYQYFERIYPGRVQAASRGWDAELIYQRMVKFNDVQRQLELAEAEYAEKPREEPTTRTGPLGLVGTKVVSREHFTARRAHYTETIHAAQQQAVSGHKFGAHGVVYFRDIVTAALASQAVHHAPHGQFRVHQAPQPSAVMWQNMGCADFPEGMLRSAAINVVMVLFIFLFAIPVALAASLANLYSLAKESHFHWLNSVLNVSPVVSGLLSGLLPVLVVIIAYSIVPLLIRELAKQRRPLSWTSLDRHCRDYYFAFLLINVFLVYSLFGTFLFHISGFLQSLTFSEVVSLLATSLPEQALFFSNLIMTRALITFPLQLLRPVDIALVYIKLKLLGKTERARREILRPMPPNLHWLYANVSVVVLITMVYSLMFPLLLLFAAVAYWLYWIICKYNILAAFAEPYGSRGELWPGGFTILMVAVYIYELTMIGLLLTYHFFAAPALIVLLVGTVLYHIYLVRTYYPAARHGALDQLPLPSTSSTTTTAAAAAAAGAAGASSGVAGNPSAAASSAPSSKTAAGTVTSNLQPSASANGAADAAAPAAAKPDDLEAADPLAKSDNLASDSGAHRVHYATPLQDAPETSFLPYYVQPEKRAVPQNDLIDLGWLD